MKTLVIAFAALCAACTGAMVLHYDPAQSRQTGVIETELDFGPPGFGRTPAEDERLTAIVLRLDRPVTIAADPQSGVNSETFTNVERIQLIQEGDVSPALAGRRVIVVGRIFQPTTGQWVTDLGMQVDQLEVEP